MFRIDVRNSRELQAVLFAIKRAPTELRKQIRQQTKTMAEPVWKKSLAEHAETRLEHRVLVDTAKVTVSDQNVRLASGGAAKKLSGGLKPSVSNRAIEFGADRETKNTYPTHSRKGKAYNVTRRTRRQLRPVRAKGYVVYPALKQIVPRIASLWVQTTVRTLHEAFERKN